VTVVGGHEAVRRVRRTAEEPPVVQVDLADVPDDAPELVLSRLLDEYRTLRTLRLQDETKRRQAAGLLLVTGLQQRLLLYSRRQNSRSGRSDTRCRSTSSCHSARERRVATVFLAMGHLHNDRRREARGAARCGSSDGYTD